MGFQDHDVQGLLDLLLPQPYTFFRPFVHLCETVEGKEISSGVYCAFEKVGKSEGIVRWGKVREQRWPWYGKEGVVGICGFLHCARELAELMKHDSVGFCVRAYVMHTCLLPIVVVRGPRV